VAHLVVQVVGPEPVQVCQVPAGGTVTIQNVGTVNVTLTEGIEAAAGDGIILAKAAATGTPGGSLTTYPPGDPTPQTWYGVTAAGVGKVVALVVSGAP
jgi:hypothetical protein